MASIARKQLVNIAARNSFKLAAPLAQARSMSGLSGSVIELSNYLEQKISQKSAEYAASSASFDEVGKVVSVGDGI
eukprot:gene18421-22153_t